VTGTMGARGSARTRLVLSGGTFLLLGLFFTIATLRLAAELPAHLYQGLVRQGVSPRRRCWSASGRHFLRGQPRM
jgi:hypothetical protein